MYALVQIKGKQYKAVKGESLKVDLYNEEPGALVNCEQVLLLSDGEKSRIGEPYIEGASVRFRLGEAVKGPKIRVFKYKRRKKYRLTRGHRQQYSLLKVEDIQGSLA